MATQQDLRDRIAELEDILGLTAEFPPAVAMKCRGIAPVQARLLGLLMKRKFLPWSCAHDALYGGRPASELPDMLALASIVKFLRKRLKPLGVTIQTVYGEGIFIAAIDKKRLLEAWPETEPKSNVVRLPTAHQRFPREVPFQ